MHKKKCVAMLLAGGQGSRLGVLTQKVAKPAVPFGGKYRIIDFPLSNCYNSGIDTVGVLTQYKPLALHSYIGIGSAWDLDRIHGGVYVLPPFVKEHGGEWYKGTADAIFQNINFIDQFNPEYVLILSGDHIYKMDYSLMLEFHLEKHAEVTIGVIEVPWEEASRFGIMSMDDNDHVTQFEEKPEQPKSNQASMGIYIFNWPLLRKHLIEDDQDTGSSHDFGHDIIPKMLCNKNKLVAYPFKGYWKDVGTVESLWQANMDLLDEKSELDMYDPNWRIYSANQPRPPHYTAATAKVNSSIISEGCLVYGEVQHSVIFPDVYIGTGAVVKNSVIMAGVHIEDNVVIDKAIIGRKAVIKQGATVAASTTEEGQDIVIVAANMIIPPHPTNGMSSASCLTKAKLSGEEEAQS